MASEPLFIDTSGWFALLNRSEPVHGKAQQVFRERSLQRPVVTTEYILAETATLLRSHHLPRLEMKFFEMVERATRLRVVWSSLAFFTRTKEFFLKHQDHGWSFTDCASFVLMREESLRDALSTDKHFKQAGFVPLLKAS